MTDSPYELVQTDDGLRLRYGFWPCVTAGCRGTIVLLGGRAEFMEKYLETIRELNERRYDVFSLDWRGQGLSDRMLEDSSKGYIHSYDHYLADLEMVLDNVVFPKQTTPVVIMAHSMGAHITLHYLSRFPRKIAKAVLMAPMIGIHTAPLPEVFVRHLAQWLVHNGKGQANIPKFRWNDSFHRPFKNNRLTSDPVRFRRVQQTLIDSPRLAVESVTFGWLAATYDAIDTLHQPGFSQSITTPMLMVAAGRDRVVSNKAIQRFASRLPENEIKIIDGASHEILQERDALRKIFWDAFDSFLT